MMRSGDTTELFKELENLHEENLRLEKELKQAKLVIKQQSDLKERNQRLSQQIGNVREELHLAKEKEGESMKAHTRLKEEIKLLQIKYQNEVLALENESLQLKDRNDQLKIAKKLNLEQNQELELLRLRSRELEEFLMKNEGHLKQLKQFTQTQRQNFEEERILLNNKFDEIKRELVAYRQFEEELTEDEETSVAHKDNETPPSNLLSEMEQQVAVTLREQLATEKKEREKAMEEKMLLFEEVSSLRRDNMEQSKRLDHVQQQVVAQESKIKKLQGIRTKQQITITSTVAELELLKKQQKTVTKDTLMQTEPPPVEDTSCQTEVELDEVTEKGTQTQKSQEEDSATVQYTEITPRGEDTSFSEMFKMPIVRVLLVAFIVQIIFKFWRPKGECH